MSKFRCSEADVLFAFLLGAKDFQEAFRIQAEYFQSRLKVCAEDAAQIGAIYAEPLGK